MVIVIPAYPMVVLGCRVECPELCFTEEDALQVLEQLVSPTFPRTLRSEEFLCRALGKTAFPSAWTNATSYLHSRALETQFMTINKAFKAISSFNLPEMYRARLQWARYIAASIIDAMYEPVVRTGFSVNLNLWARDVIYTRAGVPW